MPRLRGLTASPRSPSWPVAEYGWETRWVPLVPHPGTTALGTHSAPAERWKTWAHEGDLEPSHTYPGLSFLLCPSHRGLLVDMRSQGWQGFEKKKKTKSCSDAGRRSLSLRMCWSVNNTFYSGVYFENKSLLSPVSLLLTHPLHSDAPKWFQVTEHVSLSYSSSEGCR